MTCGRSSSHFSLGLVVGLILGAVTTTLLLSPKKEKTRSLKKEVKIPRRLIAKSKATVKKPVRAFTKGKKSLA